MPNFGAARRSFLFRATPRQGPAGWHLVRKPDRHRPAGGIWSQPVGPLNATGRRTSIPARPATPAPNSSVRRLRVRPHQRVDHAPWRGVGV